MKKVLFLMMLVAFSTAVQSQIVYNQWEATEVTDEFGDPTGETVTSAFFEGTFSNSATTNSELAVRVIDYGELIVLKLYEYKSTPDAKMCYDGCFGNITVKRASGAIETYRTYAPKGGGLYYDTKDDFMELFRNNSGETIKIVVHENNFSDYGSSKYSFTITLP